MISRIIDNSRDMRFSLMELSGGMGDLGTFIPLTIAMSLATGMDIGIILIFAGLSNIVTGLIFGLPIPVQPMKAIAAVAIAEQLLPSEIAAAGILMGLFVLLLGVTGWIEKVERLVPRPVIRGIQLGIGIKLALRGLAIISERPLIDIDSISLAVGLGVLTVIVSRWRRFPTALLLFSAGIVIAIFHWENTEAIAFGLPTFDLIVPNGYDWLNGLTRGALPQLPLTLLNSVLAVCALSGDLFGEKKISTRKMATSVGAMNLISCWFGGMPMCHGSGGLAGQYHFGARTGGSVFMLGIGKLFIGLFFGGATMSLLGVFPGSVLGLLLLFAGIELASPARDQKDARSFTVMLVTAIAILAFNTAAGFAIGMLWAILLASGRWRESKDS